MILNLDPDFSPISGEAVAFKSFTFSGGEPHIKITHDISTTDIVTITHRVNSFNDFGLLLLAIDALRRLEIDVINIFIPYFPAARQDRVANNGEAFTLKIYANILNTFNLSKVSIFDPHSKVTAELLNQSHVINNVQFISKVRSAINKPLVLVSPDAGALEKIKHLAEALEFDEVIEGSKVRNTDTRELSRFSVNTTDLKGKDCLLVDDICDGGGTILGIAKELKNINAGNLYVAVSHGIFRKGTQHLTEVFKEIYTTDSIPQNNTENVKVIQLGNLKEVKGLNLN